MTRRMLVVLFLVAGCGGSESPPASNVAGAAGIAPAAPGPSAAGSGATTPPQRCTVGMNACFCPDGRMTGTQFCDARQQLSACQCAAVAAPVNSGSTSDPTRVCAELSGMSSCEARSYVSPQVPASMLFVIDRSGSMACNPPPVQTVEACNNDPKRADPSQPSRWEITVKALNEAFTGFTGSTAEVGLSLFSTDGFCGVDSTPIVGLDTVKADHLAGLSSAMAAATPAGGTPIVGSVIQAYHHLHEELHAAGNRYVVLITDGEESCGMKGIEDDKADLAAARDRLLQTEVKKARDANIRTFVIGAPGSEGARGFLSELAFLGGTARRPDCAHGDPNATTGDCHFDLTQEKDFAGVLRTTLGQVSGQAVNCEYQTPVGSSGAANVQLRMGGGSPMCLPHDDKPCSAGANGWQFPKTADGSVDYSRVLLCGSACDAVKKDPSSIVDIILGCPVLL
ncbi:MAG TPA: vWA domain-containing protein [Polyangiales bacterium]|nr:vWA domain-containing protein [Polyangiales bacterium]